MWWWNEEGKNTITRKKVAFEELYRFPPEDNKNQYKHARNQTNNVVARALKKEAKQNLNNLCHNFNSVFSFLEENKKGK